MKPQIVAQKVLGKTPSVKMFVCPDCGAVLVPEGRCAYCRICGFSFCGM